MDTVGIVLAGGLSRRFGSPKAFAQWNGKAYYQIAVDALTSISFRIVVVGRPEHRECFDPETTVIYDVEAFAGCGPLAGIYSAMEACPAPRYAVLPCDMPYMRPEVMELLAKGYAGEDAVAVEADGVRHPLVALLGQRMKDVIRLSLERGEYSVMKLLEQVQSRWVQGSELTANPGRVFQNKNTPEQHEGEEVDI